MDAQQAYLTKLSEEIDGWPAYDKDFALYVLLGKFIEDTEKGLNKLGRDPETLEQYQRRLMLNRHWQTAKEMREVLAYGLF